MLIVLLIDQISQIKKWNIIILHFVLFLFRRFNSSHWDDKARCWNSLTVQKTYILLLSTEPAPSKAVVGGGGQHHHHHHRAHRNILVARYDDPFGAAIDFSQDTENRILKALGKKEPKTFPTEYFPIF